MRVLTFGVFDYFHYGHLQLFKRAKAQGDYLIVAVQKTEEIHKTKPNAQLLYSLEQRLEIIRSICFVDEAIPYTQVCDDVKNIDFDILVLGADQTHAGFISAVEWCKENGKKVVYLSRTPNICSSHIKESIAVNDNTK